jgi:3-oxoacyl-[acyl-carrier-protein] synthase III
MGVLMGDRVTRAGIIGIGSAVPDKIVTNFDLEKFVDTTDEWIVTRTGISERRIGGESLTSSMLGIQAAENALKEAGVAPEELDLIIVATISGDMPFPATSSLIQDRLGAKHAAAFDLQAGCSGFIYGLSVASGMVSSGLHKKVLVIGVDMLSKLTDWTDRTTCVLFGDGAGAAVVAAVEDGYGMLSFSLGSDGSGGDLLKIEAGGSKLPTSEETVKNRQHFIFMKGSEVFKFAVRIMGDASVEALEKCGLKPEDVDVFVPHQANIRIIESAARRLKLPMEKVFVNVQRYGNTSAASVPIALDEAITQGKIKKGDIVVAVGFGAGLTWAASVMKWGFDRRNGA